METISGCESLIKIEQKGAPMAYLVKTKHNSVADRMVSCCDSADCDFCIARCRSFCKMRGRSKCLRNLQLLMTYKHVLQRVLGKPAIEKHGNEEMPQGWKEDLQERCV